MRRYLVVANRTLGGAELEEELRKRIGAGPSSFYVVVPNTTAAHYYSTPVAGGHVPIPPWTGPSMVPGPMRKRPRRLGTGWMSFWQV